jgi:D-alanine-D-alanine ligase
MHHIPYTGCSVEATFVTGSKVLARKIMKSNGIPVAGGYNVSDAGELTKGRKYILKPVWEDGSLGITEESVFTFNGVLPEIARYKNDRHWFIEDFIDGREFNVSVKMDPKDLKCCPS